MRRGKQKTEWQDCKRIELNAMSAGQMISYIDQRIGNHLNGNVKVIPPTEHLAERAQIKLTEGLEAIVDNHFRS